MGSNTCGARPARSFASRRATRPERNGRSVYREDAHQFDLASEADRDASDRALGKARDEATEIIGGEIKVQKLEELVSEVVNPPVPGSALMVSPFSVEPATIEENLHLLFQERNRAPDQSCPRLLFPAEHGQPKDG